VQTTTLFRVSILSLSLGTLVACGGGGSSSASTSTPAAGGQFQTPPSNAVAVTPKD
jgi:hypothetical protein